jgi:hypothetical protein
VEKKARKGLTGRRDFAAKKELKEPKDPKVTQEFLEP